MKGVIDTHQKMLDARREREGKTLAFEENIRVFSKAGSGGGRGEGA